ncbi:MAG TPA: exosortase U [Gemmatales bacterium]|nr:exosortase U [Gemmatales bacterium]
MSIELPETPLAEQVAPATVPVTGPTQAAKQFIPPSPRTANSWLQFIPLLIVFAAFLPLLVMHGVALWAKPHYQFFPLVLLGSAVLGYFACQRQGRLNPGRYQMAALGFGFLSLLGLGAGAFVQSSLVAFGSFLVGSMAFIYSWGGWQLVKRWLPAWLFLWLIVPPPFNWDQEFITWLKFVTARWTGYVLDVFGIVHVMEGNVVIVPPYNQLLVEEACSGIHSFFAIITCALFFVFWFGRPIAHAILLIIGSICWVLAANCARVVLIAVAQVRFNVDLAHGLRHDILGFVIFLFLVLLTLSLDRLLCFVFNSTYSFMSLFKKGRMVLSKMMESQKKKVDLGTTRWPGLSVTWVYAKPILVLALLLCVFNYGLAALGVMEVMAPAEQPLFDAMAKVPEGALPMRFATQAAGANFDWERISFEVPPEREVDAKIGRFSRTWKYRTPSMDEPAIFSCDYPFVQAHDLTVCYVANGWFLLSSNATTGQLPNGDTDYVVEATFRKPDGQHAFLIFSLSDVNGHPQTPRIGSLDNFWVNRIKRFQQVLARKQTYLSYQIQAFATSYGVIKTNEQEQIKQMFHVLRNRLTQAYLAAYQGGK